jgi:hypothetical protein
MSKMEQEGRSVLLEFMGNVNFVSDVYALLWLYCFMNESV